MTDLIPFLAPAGFVLAFVVALVAGTIKGLVGFAMPMIMVSGLSSIMAPDLALAGLILPTLARMGFRRSNKDRVRLGSRSSAFGPFCWWAGCSS